MIKSLQLGFKSGGKVGKPSGWRKPRPIPAWRGSLTGVAKFPRLAGVQHGPVMKPLLSVRLGILICAVLPSFGRLAAAGTAEPPRLIGVAAVDITPQYPIRLSGYAVRTTEATNFVQRLWVKALAIGSDPEGPALLITVDNTGVPKAVRDAVVARLAKRKLDGDRIAICSSHSHTTPYLAGYLPTLFGAPLPAEHQAHVDRYTRELVDAIERAALQALKNRKPGRLSWGQTQAAFAANRRTKGGPVDHDLPLLVVSDLKGKPRAILVNYACHCTSIDPKDNQVCGDWAGYTQEYLERDHPGVTVLVAIGCGADSNPQPRGTLQLAQEHGQEIATNINRLLAHRLIPVTGPLACRAREITLPLDPAPPRAEFEARARETNYVGYHARWMLAKLERGEALPTAIPYLIEAWGFGDSLAMVFLPGEVVVDYALRLKKEFDASRFWINAYANDVPCYIPSERILTEGGYEGGGAMTYYAWPTRIAPGVEDRIVNTVHELVAQPFLGDAAHSEMLPPKSPEASLATLETKPGLEVQLVASEPLIESPVAIDWGADGKLWVVEMRDYPSGMDGNWKPGSRVKYLEDTDGDGKYDKATMVIDNIPFATGVTAWRQGALVCTAPDILYVDATGAKSPNPVRKIFSGFYTDNYQARVNSLSLGLDNWIYGANGLLGGTIHGIASGREVDIRGRDFRMHPDTGEFEPVSGLTQQGRVRDDWGDWFGCDNSTLFWHYPIPDHYLRRNPFVPAPTPRVAIAEGADPNLLHPISRTLERFNQPQSANRATSVCGLGLYRDSALGAAYEGNLFACEPVHNLVRRAVLHPKGATFGAVQPPDELQSEFLASRDNWFRPVQARTGPDGALYIVDMYRFVVEHPRWIPAERLAKLDVRAGADRGRIYRVVRAGTKPTPPWNFRKLATPKLVAALNSANGTARDLVHLELTQRADRAALAPLRTLATQASRPEVRLQALCVLDGMRAVTPEFLIPRFADPHPAVRGNALRLGEQFLAADAGGDVFAAMSHLAMDPEFTVRYQLALSLGESRDPRAGAILGQLVARDLGDPWMRAAVLSSATRQPAAILQSVLAAAAKSPGRAEMINQLVTTAAGGGEAATLGDLLATIAPADPTRREPWQFAALRSLLDALDRKGITLGALATNASAEVRAGVSRAGAIFDWARTEAESEGTAETTRELAVRLLGRGAGQQSEDLKRLARLLNHPGSDRLRAAALDTMQRNRSSEVAALWLADWNARSPALRQVCIDGLLTRDEWVKELLAALAQQTVGRNEISPAHRQRLMKHSDAAIRQRAADLFQTVNSSRAEVLARYQGALTRPGSADHGREVFAKNCSTCHLMRGVGHNVGPNLAALADKTPADWLLAIIDPNAVVEPRFVAYNLETKDERSLSGIVSAETATTLTLIQSDGLTEKLLRSDIATMRASGLSLMPEGLEQNIPLPDMADLIQFLRTTPRPFGGATPQQAETARTQFLQGGANGVAKIVAAFDQLSYPGWMGSWPMPYCRQTDGKSKLVWQTAPVAGNASPDGIASFRLPVGMGFHSGPAGKFDLRLNGKHLLDFDVALTDATWQSADGKATMNYTVLENNEQDSNGVLVLNLPATLVEAGKPATFEVIGSAANSQRWFGIYLVAGTASAPK